MRKNNNLQIDNQKKCFKIFRVNLNNDYPFSIGENISTSKNVSFALATLLRQERCLYIQIPQNWLSTVSSLINYPINYFSFSDSESNQLKKKNQSILVLSELKWHIEDIENDKELSVNDNISGTLYKEKNVIQEKERALNKLVKGLHTSISTQLCEVYFDQSTHAIYLNYPYILKEVVTFLKQLQIQSFYIQFFLGQQFWLLLVFKSTIQYKVF